jgi:hypothetical protein
LPCPWRKLVKVTDVSPFCRSCLVDVPYLIRYEAYTGHIRDIYGTSSSLQALEWYFTRVKERGILFATCSYFGVLNGLTFLMTSRTHPNEMLQEQLYGWFFLKNEVRWKLVLTHIS